MMKNKPIENKFWQLTKNMVEDKKLPMFAYRMRSVDSFLYDSLINSQIWFSNPKDFNDPFDGEITMKISEQNLSRKQSYFDTHLKPMFNAKELANINTESISNDDFQALINEAVKKVIPKKGIACFLSNHNNLMMWAQYTDSHKGVCLKFDVLEDPAFFSTAKAVKYTQAYPEYDYLNDKKEFVNEMFFTKSDEWSYEGEVRVLKPQKGNYPFNPKALKEVIFGCKITETDKNTLTKLIRMVYPHCELKQASIDNNSFKLNFAEIN